MINNGVSATKKVQGSSETTLVQSGTIDIKVQKNKYDAYCIQYNKANQAYLLAT